MPTERINAQQLRARIGGSTRAHHALVAACLDWLALKRPDLPAVPISTTGIPVRRVDGSVDLKTNERQEGFSDVVICLPPTGRMGLFEMKTGNARRTPAQRRMQARFAAAGALTVEIRDLDDFIRVIQLHGGQPARDHITQRFTTTV